MFSHMLQFGYLRCQGVFFHVLSYCRGDYDVENLKKKKVVCLSWCFLCNKVGDE